MDTKTGKGDDLTPVESRMYDALDETIDDLPSILGTLEADLKADKDSARYKRARSAAARLATLEGRVGSIRNAVIVSDA